MESRVRWIIFLANGLSVARGGAGAVDQLQEIRFARRCDLRVISGKPGMGNPGFHCAARILYYTV